MSQALPKMNVDRARAIATVQLPKRSASFAQVAFSTAAIAIPLLTIVPLFNFFTAIPAMAASFGFDFLAKKAASSDEKNALAEFYAPEIAKQLGIDTKNVTASDLELAASVNPAIAHVVNKVNEQEKSQLASSAMASAGGAVASMIVPGAGAAIKMLAPIAGSVAGGAVGSWLMSPDDLKNPQVILEKLIEERAHGAQIRPIETMLLRVAQSSELQASIKEKIGQEYYALNPEQQNTLMSLYPRIAEYAQRDAAFLNQGGDAKTLMFILPEKNAVKSSWQGKVTRAQSPQNMGIFS